MENEKIISSKYKTITQKVLTPAMLVVFILVAVLSTAQKRDIGPTPLIFGLLFMGMVVIVWRGNLQTADEVRDCGDYLWVRRGIQEEKIKLSDIYAIHFWEYSRNPLATLCLQRQSLFGDKVKFYPKTNFFGRTAIIRDLRARITTTSLQ